MARFSGLVKLRLGHAAFGSILVPELIFVERAGWRFYQPSFFGPPVLGFNIDPNIHIARFSVDVGSPRSNEQTRLILEIRSDGRVRRYGDGAQLYRCVVEGPARLVRLAAGKCSPRADDDFDLRLFHITNPKAFAGILASRELRSSRWNLQGTREMANVAYVYLTSLPGIETEEDLRRIAMASDGVIGFQTTSSRQREDTLDLKVYRESTTGRTSKLQIRVASGLLSPPHLLIHRPIGDQAYYEIVGPEIYRVGVQPGEHLVYNNGNATIDAGKLKLFQYLIVGDASSVEGLGAPYDEEDTKQVAHVESLVDWDLFNFWLVHRNSDQVSARHPEPRAFSK